MNPKRRLEIEGAYNVRDLGGYSTRDGSRTRWMRFLRADSLHRLSHSAQTTLLDYGVRTIIDLRRTNETRAEPNVFAGSAVVEYHHLNMIGDEDFGIEPLPEETERPLQIANDYFWFLGKFQIQVNQILETLVDAGNQAALFHCAGGKDRTGLISALLLGLAGVPRATIAADYSLTARYMVVPYLTYSDADADPEIRTWADYQRTYCPPETMLLVLDHLERNYGGVEGYVRTVGLSKGQIGQLRDTLVE